MELTSRRGAVQWFRPCFSCSDLRPAQRFRSVFRVFPARCEEEGWRMQRGRREKDRGRREEREGGRAYLCEEEGEDFNVAVRHSGFEES
eukprot:942918-Rhodomonas_salina.1